MPSLAAARPEISLTAEQPADSAPPKLEVVRIGTQPTMADGT